MTNEQKDEIVKWFYNHGYSIYYGDHGSRNVESDGFFWYSIRLVMEHEDEDDETVFSIPHEVHSIEEEDEYYDELMYTYTNSLYDIECFIYEIWNEQDLIELQEYINNH